MSKQLKLTHRKLIYELNFALKTVKLLDFQRKNFFLIVK